MLTRGLECCECMHVNRDGSTECAECEAALTEAKIVYSVTGGAKWSDNQQLSEREHPSLRAFLNSTGHEQYYSVLEQDRITVGTHHLYFLGPCNPLAVI